jgi:hypothetical protein
MVFSHAASQADIAVYEAIKGSLAVGGYPHAFRWYKHITSFLNKVSS